MFSFFSNIIFFFFIPCCMLKFMMNFNHLLVSLLTLELISLFFFFGLGLSLDFFYLNGFFLLYYLVIIVCEGVLGLCLLVLMSFSYGGDYLFVFNKIMC